MIAAAISTTMVVEVHAYSVPPQAKTSTMHDVVTVRTAIPQMSRGVSRRRRGRCSASTAMPSAMAPSGRFSQKIHRQLAASVSAPPINGLMTVASPKTEPIGPRNLPRSRGGTTSATIACPPTSSPAPPSPCRARNPMSCHRFCENPHSALPIRNSVIAARNSRLRPKTSPSLPYTGIATAIARV